MILLGFFTILTIIFFLSKYAVSLSICSSTNYSCRTIFDDIENLFLFGPVLFPLILLISLLPNHYFTTWWKFARIGLPLALAAVVYVNLTFTSGYMSWGTGFDLLIIGAIYGLFTLASLISVAYVWMKARR